MQRGFPLQSSQSSHRLYGLMITMVVIAISAAFFLAIVSLGTPYVTSLYTILFAGGIFVILGVAFLERRMPQEQGRVRGIIEILPFLMVVDICVFFVGAALPIVGYAQLGAVMMILSVFASLAGYVVAAYVNT